MSLYITNHVTLHHHKSRYIAILITRLLLNVWKSYMHLLYNMSCVPGCFFYLLYEQPVWLGLDNVIVIPDTNILQMGQKKRTAYAKKNSQFPNIAQTLYRNLEKVCTYDNQNDIHDVGIPWFHEDRWILHRHSRMSHYSISTELCNSNLVSQCDPEISKRKKNFQTCCCVNVSHVWRVWNERLVWKWNE